MTGQSNGNGPAAAQICPAVRTWRSATTLRLLLCGFLLLCGLTVLHPAYAAVYKTTDADGNVAFTDVPPNSTAGALQALELPTTNVYQAPATPAQKVPEAKQDQPAEPVRYQQLLITSPGHDTAIRENAGRVIVYTQVEPALQDGHNIQVLLDGQPWPGTSQGTITITNVDRGTHTLSAQVLDADKRLLISSAPITFHLQRVSVRTRPLQL